jgi:hypothetical protein
VIVGLEQIEDALRQWVIDITGLPPERVTWARQDGPRPPGLAQLAISLSLQILRTPAEDFTAARLQPLGVSSIAYTITGGALLCPAHGRATGDGPFEVTGAAAAPARWAIRVDADRIQLAASFPEALALSAVALPGSGSGQLLGAGATPSALPVVRALRGQRVLQFTVEARGGPATGSATGWAVLEHVAGSASLNDVKARVAAAGCAIGVQGQVLTPPGGLIARTTQQQLAVWTCEIHCTSEISERVGRIETFQEPTLIVI